jgi:hypothetical protein
LFPKQAWNMGQYMLLQAMAPWQCHLHNVTWFQAPCVVDCYSWQKEPTCSTGICCYGVLPKHNRRIDCY